MDSTENPHTNSVKTYRNWIQRSPMSPEKPVGSSRRDRNGGAEIFLKEVGEKPDPLLADEQIPSSLVAKTERPDSSTKLPESYEMLDKLFHTLDDSIPLCRHTNSDIISANTSSATSDCTPENLPHAMPRLAPPKRCYMTPDNDDVAKPVNELGMRPQPCCKWRKIDYTIYEDLDDDTREKVAREHMIAGLPILIDVVFFLFQSTEIFVFTRTALLFKVMSVNLDLRSRKEAEEQLALLLEHAPEWIYEVKKAPPRRDLLFIKKMIASPVEMCTRIMEAIKQDPIVNQGS